MAPLPHCTSTLTLFRGERRLKKIGLFVYTPFRAMLLQLARHEVDRMIQLTNKRDDAAAAPAAGAKEGSIWTLAHKQCSGSKATFVST